MKKVLGFDQYQTSAKRTDRTGSDDVDGQLVSVLGILGEAGDLATLFKKRLRDGDTFTVFPEQFSEELGDILWYVATLCTKLDLSLERIARQNLKKTMARWRTHGGPKKRPRHRDRSFPAKERLPRTFTVEFRESKRRTGPRLTLLHNGKQCGDHLTDNSHYEDGYRYHDIFHLAYAAVLGWSPVTRKILKCKRRSDHRTDEIEDGGRARVIEEGISALVFQYAEKHKFLDGVGRVDSDLLSLITRLTANLEVSDASTGEWEAAILSGFSAFRLLSRHKGGLVTADLDERTLVFKNISGTK
jgi:NTP pyrophosphatase (non-canonical NTP hydrolase)